MSDEIRSAIDREQVVEFFYPGREGGWLRRVFSPWEIKGESVLGWDHGRDEPRRYRFDKMGSTFTDAPEEYMMPHA